MQLSLDSKITLYADDILLFKPIRKKEDYKDIQQDIDTLYTWSASSRLIFNSEKCKYMLITRKRSNSLTPPPLSLGPSIIERTYSYKYLGVTISSNLSWSEHIHAICTKAKRLLGFLYRHFYSNANTSSLLKLYISLIRPHLEYACQVWHPHLLTDINKLESVQKFALRLCVKRWDLGYDVLLSMCDLPILATRRKYFDLCIMYKIINHQIYFPPHVFVPRITPSHSASDLLFNQPFSRTNSFLFSFVPLTYCMWNSLPMSVRSADSFSLFKSLLIDWLYHGNT